VAAKLGDEGQYGLPVAALADLLPLLVNLATTEDQPANQMVRLLYNRLGINCYGTALSLVVAKGYAPCFYGSILPRSILLRCI
jgi:hypothetical protein